MRLIRRVVSFYVLGAHVQISESVITWPSDSSNIESMRVVHFEIVLHHSPLHLSMAVEGREEIFGIDFIFHLLVSGIKQINAVRVS